ncbi:MAG: hypothetical protein FAF05_04460 [Epsilonproteobacteria bacterium]|nr:hypothetical protein [Campylobacterota bacterium]
MVRIKSLWILLILSQMVFTQEVRELALAKGMQPLPDSFEELAKYFKDSATPLTREKVILGKKLFFDPNLSLSRQISCASCHQFDLGGADGLPTAIGHEGLANPSHLNSPTVFNTAFSKYLFWDGRSRSLEDQAK